MSRSRLAALLLAGFPLLLFPILLCAGTGRADPKPNPGAHAQDEGARLFETNCSRCHTPPMSISPRTAGTILMHMRTRARLSRKDEQALLKFMAP
jgi:mono/diheme cytochrome c family protein